MKTYDTEQIKAIEATGGYYLVLAPPGCGKTDILSERIVKAKEKGVNYEDMLCLTFTNRASRGMLDRVKQRVGDDAGNIFVGNVHRFCSKFLYSNSLIPENSSIIDDEDLADILLSMDDFFFKNNKGNLDKEKVQRVDNIDAYILQRNLQHSQSVFFLPQTYEKYYQLAKTANFIPEQLITNNDELLVKYALLYHKYKEQYNIISFSDILILAYDNLINNKTLEFKRYRWIQVDEVQDLNALQMAIIDELLDKTGDFTAMYLGDEQQAIFSFLGAKMGQLEQVKNRCAGHIMTLGSNYRSPKYLLDIYNKFAEEELKVNLDLLPHATKQGEHDKLDLILTGNSTVEDESNRVLKMIAYYLGFDDDRIAILVPTNMAADRISQKLTDNRIAHFKISGTDLFKSKSYKTLSSFFCICVNDFNALAWSRLLYGMGAIKTGAGSRNFVAKLRSIMMTPSDLLTGRTYVDRFKEDYDSKEFVFFDTETTGLNVLEDDIVQIAAFKVYKGKRVPNSDFVVYLHTDKPIPEKLGDKDNPLIEAYANNSHLSREEGLQLFIDYIGDCPILGHNVSFDYQILQSNVENTLSEQVSFVTYDSLQLIKCVEPNLHQYNLEFLLKRLNLQGQNTHLADDDISATKSLVDYCYQKMSPVIIQQNAFLSQPKVKKVINIMQPLSTMMENLKGHMYKTVQTIGRTIADELNSIHNDMVSLQIIEPMGEKFNTFLQYVQSEWVDYNNPHTLFDEISEHITDMTGSVSEGDLVNSEGLIQDRVFVMTVYKGKGLEFENVVILESNDGTYPFYKVNQILNNPHRHTPEELSQAKTDRMEDARKFYVAISRAKKRLCISYTDWNSFNFPTQLTPFMNCIKDYFGVMDKN